MLAMYFYAFVNLILVLRIVFLFFLIKIKQRSDDMVAGYQNSSDIEITIGIKRICFQ